MIADSLRCLGWAGAFVTCVAMAEAEAQPAAAPKAMIAILPNEQANTFTLSSNPMKEFSLSFDVRAIPVGATVVSAKLRIVPCRTGQAPDSPQDIRIFGASAQLSIGQLVKSRDVSPIESVGDGLKTAVVDAVRAGTTLKLRLTTTSRTPDQTYYLNTADNSNNPACKDPVPVGPKDRPRLLVEASYGDSNVVRDGAQLRYRDRTLDATPWKHDLADSVGQNAVVASEPSSALGLDQIFAGPAFIGDQILLAAKKASDSPRLYAVGWNGTKTWDSELPKLTDSVKQWKYILADNQDRLLAFASDSKIRVYPGLGSRAPANLPLEKNIQDLNLAKPPLLTMGGMIVYRSGGSVYALSPLGGEVKQGPPTGWEPLMQFGSAGQAQTAISPWNGENLLYVTPVDNDMRRSGIVVFDPARGVQKFPPGNAEAGFPEKESELAHFPHYNPLQVLARDPGKDLVLLSGSGDSSVVWANWGFASGAPGGWRRPCIASQPDCGSAKSISSCIASQPDGKGKTFLYCVDGSATEQEFRKLGVPTGAEVCSSTLKRQLKPSSNLVADGAGNVFFWVGEGNDAGFYGFTSGCQNIVFSTLKSTGAAFVLPSGPLDLHAGPNGVFYLRDNTRLIAIEPVRKIDSVPQLARDTRYATDGDLAIQADKAPRDGPVILASTSGKLALGSLLIPNGGDVTCSGRTGVTFGNGFRVQQGGVLRCGINSAKIISP